MSDATSTSAPPSKGTLIALLVAFPLVCAVVGFAALPRPETLAAAREKADRAPLRGVVQTTPFTMQKSFNAQFERIAVRGVTLPAAPVKVGGELAIDFFFEATKEMNRNWKVFAHIDRQGQSHRIHGDHFPAGGRYPTTLWRSGEFVRDHFAIDVGNAPPGKYEVWIGFYIDNDRMSYVSGAPPGSANDNRFLVGSFEVVK